MTLNEVAKEIKNNAEIGDVYFNDSEAILALLDEREKLLAALETVTALTYSWIMAEQTINCKHTYDQIRNIAKEALALSEGEPG